jgi:hypothetical protein
MRATSFLTIVVLLLRATNGTSELLNQEKTNMASTLAEFSAQNILPARTVQTKLPATTTTTTHTASKSAAYPSRYKNSLLEVHSGFQHSVPEEQTCEVTPITVDYFKNRITAVVQQAIATAKQHIQQETGGDVTSDLVQSAFDALFAHINGGGALTEVALKNAMGESVSERVKELGATALEAALEAANFSIFFCLRKRIEGKFIYFQGYLRGNFRTQTLSGSLNMLSRIDAGYFHLFTATVAVTNVDPRQTPFLGQVTIIGEFCGGSTFHCHTAQYGVAIDTTDAVYLGSDAYRNLTAARGKTFAGSLTIAHNLDGSNQISLNSGPEELTLGKVFYVSVGAATTETKANNLVAWLGPFAGVGVSNMGLEWTKTAATTDVATGGSTGGTVVKKMTGSPSFGATDQFTCDVTSNAFTAVKCALKGLAATAGDSSIAIVSERNLVPGLDASFLEVAQEERGHHGNPTPCVFIPAETSVSACVQFNEEDYEVTPAREAVTGTRDSSNCILSVAGKW